MPDGRKTEIAIKNWHGVARQARMELIGALVHSLHPVMVVVTDGVSKVCPQIVVCYIFFIT